MYNELKTILLSWRSWFTRSIEKIYSRQDEFQLTLPTARTRPLSTSALNVSTAGDVDSISISPTITTASASTWSDVINRLLPRKPLVKIPFWHQTRRPPRGEVTGVSQVSWRCASDRGSGQTHTRPASSRPASLLPSGDQQRARSGPQDTRRPSGASGWSKSQKNSSPSKAAVTSRSETALWNRTSDIFALWPEKRIKRMFNSSRRFPKHYSCPHHSVASWNSKSEIARTVIKQNRQNAIFKSK